MSKDCHLCLPIILQIHSVSTELHVNPTTIVSHPRDWVSILSVHSSLLALYTWSPEWYLKNINKMSHLSPAWNPPRNFHLIQLKFKVLLMAYRFLHLPDLSPLLLWSSLSRRAHCTCLGILLGKLSHWVSLKGPSCHLGFRVIRCFPRI